MVYTENGLCITLNELKRLVTRVENENKRGNMEPCIYVKGGDRPRIIQYCYYAECFPIDFTNSAKSE